MEPLGFPALAAEAVFACRIKQNFCDTDRTKPEISRWQVPPSARLNKYSEGCNLFL